MAFAFLSLDGYVYFLEKKGIRIVSPRPQCFPWRSRGSRAGNKTHVFHWGQLLSAECPTQRSRIRILRIIEQTVTGPMQSVWQKRSQGWWPLFLQKLRIALTGQNGEETSCSIKISRWIQRTVYGVRYWGHVYEITNLLYLIMDRRLPLLPD